MPHASRAFTLIELCAVALLLAIAAVIGLPAFGQLLSKAQLAKASAALADDMASARRAAIDRRRPVAICPSLDGRRCGPGSPWHHGWIILDGTRVLSVHEGLPGRLTATASRSVSGMHFDPAGRATADNDTITLCLRKHPETAVAVVVSMAGRIHREVPDRARSVACAGSREDNR